MQTEEARMHDRVPFTNQVAVIASSSSPPLRLWASNLSEGGICLQTNHPFRRGDRVGLRVKNAEGDLTIPVGEVSWVVREVKNSSRIPMVGLRFMNLRPADRQLLRRMVETENEAVSPLPPLTPSTNHNKEASHMNAEPSLPPIGESFAPGMDADASMPPTNINLSTLPPLDTRLSVEPSLTGGQEPASRWEFSKDNPSVNSAAPRRAGTSPSLALGAGLLVVGTLAGMIFGVLDQNGRHPEKSAVTAAATPAPAPAAEVEAAAPDEDMAAPPITRPAPKPAAVAAAPLPKPAAPAARPAAPAPVLTNTVAQSARPAVTLDKMPLPNHRPGRVELGAIQAAGKELVVPIRGARAMEKTFILKTPDRVVVDLTADGFDGQKEMSGKGTIKKMRLGARPGGVRLVLDVKDERVAKAAKITRRNGVLSVVLPAQ
jgi:uncharacterized protein (TIGR02266 family)